ncbi:MAG: chemotaxis protein CheW [Gemmatimonadetes bacterium]|nr:chemotaxis protein CheW [Gemmatimonadota bacterium]
MADLVGARLLVFRVGTVQCAVDASVVQEITSMLPATRIPGAPEQVAGVVNVRGRIVTLVDARKCLGQASQDGEGLLMLLELGTRIVGLVVDEVIDLISASDDTLAERDELPGIEAVFVRAVGQYDGQSFAMLDTDALLNPILPS